MDKSNDRSPKSAPGSSEKVQPSARSIDEALKDLPGVEPEIGEFISENWHKLGYLLAGGIGVIFLYHYFGTVRQDSKAEIARQFAKAQIQFEHVLKPEPKEEVAGAEKKVETESPAPTPGEVVKEEGAAEPDKAKSEVEESKEVAQEGESQKAKDEVGFKETMGLLERTSANKAYGQLALLYLASLELERKDYASLRSRLDRTFPESDLNKLLGVTSADHKFNGKELLTELAMLMKARSYVEESEQLKAQGAEQQEAANQALEHGLELARKLVQLGGSVSSEALVLLSRAGADQVEKTELQKLASELVSKRPDLRDTLSNDLPLIDLQS